MGTKRTSKSLTLEEEDRVYQRRRENAKWKDIAAETAVKFGKQWTIQVVRQEQSIGEPHHWLLLLARENQLGDVFQVKGDAVTIRYIEIVLEHGLKNSKYSSQELSPHGKLDVNAVLINHDIDGEKNDTHANDVNVLNSQSYKDSFIIAQLDKSYGREELSPLL